MFYLFCLNRFKEQIINLKVQDEDEEGIKIDESLLEQVAKGYVALSDKAIHGLNHLQFLYSAYKPRFWYWEVNFIA